MIKAILFDFRDTLICVEKGYKEQFNFLYTFVGNQGIKIKRDKLDKMFHDVIKETINNYRAWPLKRQLIHNWHVLYVLKIFKLLNLKLTEKKLTQFLTNYDNVFVDNVSLFPEALPIIKFFHKQHLKMGVVIEGMKPREQAILKRFSLNKFLDAIVISEQVGKNKFNSLPLKTALKKIGVPARHVLVVGDRIDKDVIHANKLGCISVKLERHQGRYTDIKALKANEKPNYVINNLKELVPIVTTSLPK